MSKGKKLRQYSFDTRLSRKLSTAIYVLLCTVQLLLSSFLFEVQSMVISQETCSL
jgi:hypothetical protein